MTEIQTTLLRFRSVGFFVVPALLDLSLRALTRDQGHAGVRRTGTNMTAVKYRNTLIEPVFLR